MAVVALAIVASTAVGMGSEHRFGADAQRFARLVIDALVWVLSPFIVFFVTVHLHLGGGVGVGLGLAFVELGAVGALAHLVATRVLRLSRPATGSLVCLVILGNTGYLGIPLTAALLGHGALAPAIAWDTIVSQVMLYGFGFAVGAAFGTGAGETPRQRVRAFFTRNPVLYALLAGLLAPDALAPQALVDVARALAVYTLLPLGFFVVGVNLMAEREGGALPFPPPFSPPVAVAVILRLMLAPALLFGLSRLTVRVPDAYIMQAAMPSGINTLMVGHLYGLDLKLASSGIAWSTAIAVAGALALAPVI